MTHDPEEHPLEAEAARGSTVPAHAASEMAQTGATPTVDEPAQTGVSPTVDEPSPTLSRRRSISRAAWAALVVGVVLVVFMLVFILQNNAPAQFTLLAWSFTMSMGVAMLFAAVAGALVTAMVGTVRMMVLGRNVRRLERRRTSKA